MDYRVGQVRIEPKMTTRLAPWGPDREHSRNDHQSSGATTFRHVETDMSEMTPSLLHNALAWHSTPETIPEITPDTKRPWALLRGASRCWTNGRERETKGCAHNEEKQNRRLSRVIRNSLM